MKMPTKKELGLWSLQCTLLALSCQNTLERKTYPLQRMMSTDKPTTQHSPFLSWKDMGNGEKSAIWLTQTSTTQAVKGKRVGKFYFFL